MRAGRRARQPSTICRKKTDQNTIYTAASISMEIYPDQAATISALQASLYRPRRWPTLTQSARARNMVSCRTPDRAGLKRTRHEIEFTDLRTMRNRQAPSRTSAPSQFAPTALPGTCRKALRSSCSVSPLSCGAPPDERGYRRCPPPAHLADARCSSSRCRSPCG